MKRLPLALLLALGLSFQASAQIPYLPNGCPTCRVYAWVDAPRDYLVTVKGFGELPGALPIVEGAWVIMGWGFECQSGRPVDRVDVAYSSDDGVFKPAPWYLTRLDVGVPRPDVAAAYRGTCPEVAGDTGYTLHLFPGAVPLGTRVITITARRGPYSSQSRRIVVVR